MLKPKSEEDSPMTQRLVAMVRFLGILGACLITGSTWGQVAAAFSDKVVFLVPDDGEGATYEALVQSVHSHLSDVPVNVSEYTVSHVPMDTDADVRRLRQIAASEQAVLLVWFNSPPDDRIRFFVPDDAGGQLIVRVLEEPPESTAEAMGLVVRSTVTTVLSLRNQEKRVERPPTSVPVAETSADRTPAAALSAPHLSSPSSEPSEPVPSPAPTSSSPAVYRFGVGLGAEILTPSASATVRGGGTLSLYGVIRKHLMLRVGFALENAQEVVADDIHLTVRNYPVNLAVMVPFKIEQWDFAAVVGGQMELQRFDLKSSRENVLPVSKKRYATVGARAGLQGMLRLSRRIALYAAPELLLRIQTVHYALAENTQTRYLLRLKRLVFIGEIGVRIFF